MSSTKELHPDLFVGPMLAGLILVYFLFGILSDQLTTYVGSIPADSVAWRYPHYLVVITFLLEILSLVAATVSVWDLLVTNGSQLPWLWTPPPLAPATGVLNGLVGFTVHAFFAAKVWRLATKPFERGLAALIAMLAVAQLTASCTVSAYFAIQGRTYSPPMEKAIIVFLGSTVACDVLITGSMTHLFRGYKKRTSLPETKQLLRTLTRNTLENGLITSVCALVNLIIFFTRKLDFLHMVFQYVIGRLYAILLLASLNRGLTSRRDESERGSRAPARSTTNTGIFTDVHVAPFTVSKSDGDIATSCRMATETGEWLSRRASECRQDDRAS